MLYRVRIMEKTIVPYISVIIPTFNRIHSLPGALESVLAQTSPDFEVIIVDDGSTDETPLFCSTLHDNRIIVKRFEKNLGGNYARNEGIRISRGELIAFCDDDDSWMPQKLEKQVAAISRHGSDLCYCGKNIVKMGKPQKKYSFYSPRYSDLHKSIMADNFIGSTSTVIIKKKVLEAIGAFDENLPALQDYDVYIRLISRGYSIFGVDEPLIDYNVVNEERSISCNLDVFNKSSKYLFLKFHDDPYLKLLKRGLRIITLKRMIKSRWFLSGIFRSMGRGIFSASEHKSS